MPQHNLSIGDAERLAEWFLHRMPVQQRLLLMADMPLVYARVTDVNPATVAEVVADALTTQHADSYAAKLAALESDADTLVMRTFTAAGLADDSAWTPDRPCTFADPRSLSQFGLTS
jgi:hypothetical protein